MNIGKKLILKNVIKKYSLLSKNFSIKFKVALSPNNIINVEANEGETFFNVIQKYDFKEMGICGGNIICATCHIILPSDIYSKINPMQSDEEELVINAPKYEKLSRLGCQVKIDKNFEGITVKAAIETSI